MILLILSDGIFFRKRVSKILISFSSTLLFPFLVSTSVLKDANWENTKRSAAIHWGEANPGNGWFVHGIHYIVLGGRETIIADTQVIDCSIYDGWWDY